MQSRISYFNGTAFRKNITRFAPAWAIYLAGCLLVLLNFVNNDQPSAAFRDLNGSLMLMAAVNFLYALLVAELVFGDLFNTRLCNALHAMPMRREGWFLTNVASGLCFGIVPYLVLALCLLPRLEWWWSSAFVWMLVADLQYFFFFGLAVFCVFCTGNRFAMALVYGLINFFSLLLGWLVDALYIPLMNGVLFSYDPFQKFCPVVQLSSISDYFAEPVADYDVVFFARSRSESWIYLIILAVLGIGLLIGALLLYRKRNLECAGDFVAVKPLGPVFRVIYTLTVGGMFQLFGELFMDESGITVFLVAGLLIGYFTGHMLVQRRVKVFNLRTLIGFGVLAVVLFGSMGIARLDPFGVVRWVPQAAEVKSVTISSYNQKYSDDYMKLTDPTDIQTITAVHQGILEQERTDGDQAVLYLTYHMTDGKTVRRYYRISVDSEEGKTLNAYFSRPEHVLGYTDWAKFLDSVSEVYVENGSFTGEDARELLEAIRADCEAETMNQNGEYHQQGGTGYYYAWVSYGVDQNGDGYADIHWEITVFSDARNTVNWLEARREIWSYEK